MEVKVMLVDDSVLVRKMLGRALNEAGFATIEASDGADALRKLAANADVRLVVCDVNMPTMTGLEFLAVLQEEKSEKTPLVVVFTTEGQPEVLQRARSLGAAAWIVKPARPEAVVSIVTRLLAA